jgi:hypothetical protein
LSPSAIVIPPASSEAEPILSPEARRADERSNRACDEENPRKARLAVPL